MSKKIPDTPMVAANLDGNDTALREWATQSNTPVAIWDGEPPRPEWFEQFCLAKRLTPNPPLTLDNIEDRRHRLGDCHEIYGESGHAWSRRLTIAHSMRTSPDVDEGAPAFWAGFGNKCGYGGRYSFARRSA